MKSTVYQECLVMNLPTTFENRRSKIVIICSPYMYRTKHVDPHVCISLFYTSTLRVILKFLSLHQRRIVKISRKTLYLWPNIFLNSKNNKLFTPSATSQVKKWNKKSLHLHACLTLLRLNHLADSNQRCLQSIHQFWQEILKLNFCFAEEVRNLLLNYM